MNRDVRARVALGAGIVSGAALVWALSALIGARSGVEQTTERLGPTPVSVFRPASTSQAEADRPVVVIAHGFAGSQQLMRSHALTLARNGYLAVSFDFLGHGRNREPLRGDITEIEGATRHLVKQTRQVIDHALSKPDAGGGLALLGHSMASDILVRTARSDPRVDATVTFSMFSPAVTSTVPKNLLTITGELEGFLRKEALRVVGLVTDDPKVGVTYGSFEEGTARRAAVAGGVEHVGILFSTDGLQEALKWLDQVFDRTSTEPVARRGLAIAVLFLALGVLAWPLSRFLPRVCREPAGASLSWKAFVPAVAVPAIATPLLLMEFPPDFLSVLVGGYLAVHFGLYGILTFGCLFWLARRYPEAAPYRRRVLVGPLAAASAAAVVYGAGSVGWAMDTFVTSFAVTSARLPLVFAMFLGTAAYFSADEWLTRGHPSPRGAQWVSRAAFLASLGLAVVLSFEDLFFLLIISFVILLYFGIYGLFGEWVYRATGHPAPGAVTNAVAFAWALAVVFPMLAG
ncbi:MAG TPA: alpha/beta hydrolase [Myxococcales bacterium LLY-WYZ-16_1]|nr:alpha/beta hydrolase [Myxococcales bacterium LLY-WYZ-16_1]